MKKRERMGVIGRRWAWRGWGLRLLGGLICLGLGLGLRGELVVSELLYWPSEEEGGERGEYMELRNRGYVAVDVSGWYFDRGIEFVFPAGSVIGAREHLVVAKDADYLVGRYYGIELGKVVGGYSGRLSNSGERIRLRDTVGMERIDFEYGVGGDWPAVAFGGTGHSLEFVGDWARDMGDGRAWAGSRHPKGALMERPSWWTAEMYAALNSLRGVVINEVGASRSMGMDYVEFYNPTGEAIDMSGAWLSDEGSELGKHRLPAGSVIGSGEFFVVEVSGEGTGFGLSSSGETIYLAAPDGSFVVGAYGFGPQERDVSIGRYPDGGRNWYRSVEGSPGEANGRLYRPLVGISELMYHSREGAGGEYLELYVLGEEAVDVSGWEFRGVRFGFGAGVVLEPGRYYVIADEEAGLRAGYELPLGSLLGEYGGSLSNGGERISLLDAWDVVVDSVRYEDGLPWPFGADGLGSSLERGCWELSYDEAGAWTDSPLGRPSPGRANSKEDCEEAEEEGVSVRVSEFVYHPGLRGEDDRGTEFIELTNYGGEAMSLEGWSLVEEVFYEFGEGVVLGSGESIVVAWSPERLAQEYSWLGEGGVVGAYEGDMGNGGGRILLVRPDKSLADGVVYDDDFPWPSLADGGLADGEGGDISLRRACWEGIGWDASNWVAEREPSPGRREGEEGACEGPAVLWEAGTEPERVRGEEGPLLAVRFAKGGLVDSARVRYWVEDIEADGGEAVMSLGMSDLGEGKWSVRMPLLPVNSIVRYQVEWEERGGRRGVSPSEERDAFGWHGYFVEPQGLNGRFDVYHLFLSSANWRRLEENIAVGPVIDNRDNPRWNEEVPAVFVANGIVHDVQARHQGSRLRRHVSAGDIPFECASSRNDDQVPFLNWRIDFPSYRKHDGMDVLILRNSHGWVQHISFRLFELAGVPAPRTGWAKLRINGCDYTTQRIANISRGSYRIERPGRDFIARWFDEVGDLFKTQVSPLFRNANADLLTGPIYNYTKQERYEHIYNRKTLEWKNNPFDGVGDAPQAMIEALHQARGQGKKALRAWLAEHFDVDLTLRYLCAQNYVATRDGSINHNYFLYKKADDGKWCLLPWDLDASMLKENAMMHPFNGGDESRFGNVGNLWGNWNRIRDSFFIAYEAEYLEMLYEFNNTIYHPEALLPVVQEAAISGGFSESWIAWIMPFIYQRHDFLNCYIAGTQCPPPLLTLRIEEGQILLEWPAGRSDYILETAAAIDYEEEEDGYKVDWIEVPTTNNRYLVPPNHLSAFFRLAPNKESITIP